MRIEAYAKVNFTLEVLGKRVDGYHALRSVVLPISLADTLEFVCGEWGERGGAHGCAGESPLVTSDTGYADDLCLKAARTLRSLIPKAGTGARVPDVRIHVTKRIPAGGGLGGGSADAAATLIALNDLWRINLPVVELAARGAQVGSDVPALVLAQALRVPVLMEGRGETVRPLFPPDAAARLPVCHLVLANPGVFSSTPEVFRHAKSRVTDKPEILYNITSALESGELTSVAAALQNDLEDPACALHPEIASAKAALVAAGAAGVLMSGSGSTVFGLVPTEAAGHEIAASLNSQGLLAWPVRTVCPVV